MASGETVQEFMDRTTKKNNTGTLGKPIKTAKRPKKSSLSKRTKRPKKKPIR